MFFKYIPEHHLPACQRPLNQPLESSQPASDGQLRPDLTGGSSLSLRMQQCVNPSKQTSGPVTSGSPKDVVDGGGGGWSGTGREASEVPQASRSEKRGGPTLQPGGRTHWLPSLSYRMASRPRQRHGVVVQTVQTVHTKTLSRQDFQKSYKNNKKNSRLLQSDLLIMLFNFTNYFEPFFKMPLLDKKRKKRITRNKVAQYHKQKCKQQQLDSSPLLSVITVLAESLLVLPSLQEQSKKPETRPGSFKKQP